MKEAKTLPAIKELKNYYLNEASEEDQDIRQDMIEALAVEGFAAWIIHSAIKRNNYKNRKGLSSTDIRIYELPLADLEYRLAAQQAMQPSNPPPRKPVEASAGESSKKGTTEEVTPGKAIFDPVRSV